MHANGTTNRMTAATPEAKAPEPVAVTAPPAWFRWAYAGALAGGILILPAVGLFAAVYLALIYRIFRLAAGL